MISSDGPYESDVSSTVMPASRAASITARLASRSSFEPKLLHPRPTVETASPDCPRRRYVMSAIRRTVSAGATIGPMSDLAATAPAFVVTAHGIVWAGDVLRRSVA